MSLHSLQHSWCLAWHGNTQSFSFHPSFFDFPMPPWWLLHASGHIRSRKETMEAGEKAGAQWTSFQTGAATTHPHQILRFLRVSEFGSMQRLMGYRGSINVRVQLCGCGCGTRLETRSWPSKMIPCKREQCSRVGILDCSAYQTLLTQPCLCMRVAPCSITTWTSHEEDTTSQSGIRFVQNICSNMSCECSAFATSGRTVFSHNSMWHSNHPMPSACSLLSPATGSLALQ